MNLTMQHLNRFNNAVKVLGVPTLITYFHDHNLGQGISKSLWNRIAFEVPNRNYPHQIASDISIPTSQRFHLLLYNDVSSEHGTWYPVKRGSVLESILANTCEETSEVLGKETTLRATLHTTWAKIQDPNDRRWTDLFAYYQEVPIFLLNLPPEPVLSRNLPDAISTTIMLDPNLDRLQLPLPV